MAKPTVQPGPGLSTSQDAFDRLKTAVAQQNEAAHKKARQLRTVKEQERARWRREQIEE